MKFKIKYADQIVDILSIIAIIALIFIIFLIGSTQKWFVPKHNYYTVISTAANISVGKSITYKGFEIGKIKNHKAFNILLAHNPDYFDNYVSYGADLTLSGHVHGGLYRVFGKGLFSPRIAFFPKYDGGMFTKDKKAMIVSRGLGNHSFPHRFLNPGELILIHLKEVEKN